MVIYPKTTVSDFVEYDGLPPFALLPQDENAQLLFVAFISLGFDNQMGTNVLIPCVVEWDGKIYNTTAHCERHADGADIVIGNLKTAGGADTGEPFAISLAWSGFLVCSLTDTEPHTFTIYDVYEAAEKTEDSLSYIKFLCSPDFPFLPKNIWGWKMAQKRGDS